MLSDSDPAKWGYLPHTEAKHAILVRYMKAWLSILGAGARQAGRGADLVIVDAFAGRGRYTNEASGSPLLLRDLAGRVVSDRRVDRVDLTYIENDPENFAALVAALRASDVSDGVIEHGPLQTEFSSAAPDILRSIGNRSSFWFLDPFGFRDLPLHLIHQILGRRRAEVFLTLMVRDMIRFLDNPPHQQAIARTLGWDGDALRAAVTSIKQSSDRGQALHDLYVSHLEGRLDGGRQRYVTSVRVAAAGRNDTVYYLVHATGHPLGKREMKEAVLEATGGLNAVWGAADPAVVESRTGQMGLFTGEVSRDMDVNYGRLRELLHGRFAGRNIEYDALLNESVVGHDFNAFIDRHIKTALEQLEAGGAIHIRRSGLAPRRAVRRGDIVTFPPR